MTSGAFTVLLRSFLKHKMFSIINVGGLAIGLAACVLILLFVRQQLSYDTMYADADRIYRLEGSYVFPGRTPGIYPNASGRVLEPFANYFAGDVEAISILYRQSGVLRVEDQYTKETISFAGPQFFEVFDLPLLSGSAEDVFRDENSVLLTRETAVRLFGYENPVGETFVFDDEDFRVVGVLEDLPENTHLGFDIVGHFTVSRFEDAFIMRNWFSYGAFIYVKLFPGASPENIQNQMDTFLDSTIQIEQDSLASFAPSELTPYILRPLLDIQLYSPSERGQMKPVGDIQIVLVFSSIAVLILVIASINFTNLSIARALRRAREVAVRKVLGASRKQLILQFLGESLFLAFVGMLLAFVLVEIALPFFSQMAGQELTTNYVRDPVILIGVLLLTLFVGCIGGLYPAVYLSRFRPGLILRANKSSADVSPALRNGLVGLQFVISIGLIVTTAVMYSQVNYMRSINLGLEGNQRLVLHDLDSDQADQRYVLKQQVEALPGVIDTAFAYDTIPFQRNNSTNVIVNDETGTTTHNIRWLIVGFDFFEIMEIPVVAGRSFSRDFASDIRPSSGNSEGQRPSYNIMINQAASRQLGFPNPEDAIGQQVVWGQGDQVTIIGVTDDFHIGSAENETLSMVFLNYEDGQFSMSDLVVHLRADNIQSTLGEIDRLWANLVPEQPIDRSFVSEDFAALYDEDERQGTIFASFAGFAIFVASLGLYGLAAFSAERRTKEIGIRKVMGARIRDIMQLMIWQFSKPVLIANLIAWPVAWYFLSDWLSDYANRIELSPIYFLLAAIIALLIAWVTVAGHAYRVARTNPVHALRVE